MSAQSYRSDSVRPIAHVPRSGRTGLRLLPAALGLAAVALAYQPVPAEAGVKRDYCYRQDYVTRTGARQPQVNPHLHCIDGQDKIVYKSSQTNHRTVMEQGTVNTAKTQEACAMEQGQTTGNRYIFVALGYMCNDQGVQCPPCN